MNLSLRKVAMPVLAVATMAIATACNTKNNDT